MKFRHCEEQAKASDQEKKLADLERELESELSGFQDESIHEFGMSPAQATLETAAEDQGEMDDQGWHDVTPDLAPDTMLPLMSPMSPDSAPSEGELDDAEIESALADFDAALEDMHL
eukprot:TRINITY_DN5453_c0_g2_i1.p1 TRINITY_DN5453_c0_g2~~TRINITY_DN5453_c0_g2_i1.p1  ORF type:complete len:117 (-),score=14.93 TRINITY_DN5453_c0_g2_i1:224-574(-)